MWTHASRRAGARTPASRSTTRRFSDLRDALLRRALDFDYGDEEILSRHGRVVEGGPARLLVVGKAAYKAVLVPPMNTMRATTLELLGSSGRRRDGGVRRRSRPRYRRWLHRRPPWRASPRECPPAPACGKDAARPWRHVAAASASPTLPDRQIVPAAVPAARGQGGVLPVRLQHRLRVARKASIRSNAPLTARADTGSSSMMSVVTGSAGAAGKPLELDPADR